MPNIPRGCHCCKGKGHRFRLWWRWFTYINPVAHCSFCFSLCLLSVSLCLRLQTCQCQKIWTGSRLGTAVEGVPYKMPSYLQERVMACGHCRATVSCGSLHLRYNPNFSNCTADFYYAVKINTIIKIKQHPSEKYNKKYLKFRNFTLSILQINVHIYVLNKITITLYF